MEERCARLHQLHSGLPIVLFNHKCLGVLFLSRPLPRPSLDLYSYKFAVFGDTIILFLFPPFVVLWNASNVCNSDSVPRAGNNFVQQLPSYIRPLIVRMVVVSFSYNQIAQRIQLRFKPLWCYKTRNEHSIYLVTKLVSFTGIAHLLPNMTVVYLYWDCLVDTRSPNISSNSWEAVTVHESPNLRSVRANTLPCCNPCTVKSWKPSVPACIVSSKITNHQRRLTFSYKGNLCCYSIILCKVSVTLNLQRI